MILVLKALEIVMFFSGAYITGSEEVKDFVPAVIDVLRKKDKMGADCCAAAIAVLNVMVFRRVCLDNPRFEQYESLYMNEFADQKGYEIPNA